MNYYAEAADEITQAFRDYEATFGGGRNAREDAKNNFLATIKLNIERGYITEREATKLRGKLEAEAFGCGV
jgi:hypothetical protein